jgi:hypothetical protein
VPCCGWSSIIILSSLKLSERRSPVVTGWRFNSYIITISFMLVAVLPPPPAWNISGALRFRTERLWALLLPLLPSVTLSLLPTFLAVSWLLPTGHFEPAQLFRLDSLPTHPPPSGGFPALSRQLIPLGRPYFEERMDLSPDRVVGGLAQGAKFRRFPVRALDRIGLQAVFHDGRDPIRHGFQKFGHEPIWGGCFPDLAVLQSEVFDFLLQLRPLQVARWL